MSYLILDTETGGIGIDKSLLTAFFVVTDDQFRPIDELSLELKPNDGIYRTTGEALEINKIDLKTHDKVAVTYSVGGTALYNFLKKNSDGGKIKLVPVGHGFSGDLDHIFDKLVSRNTWESFVSYRRLDTSVALQFLKACGVFPETVSGSLASIVEYFNIKLPGELHTAKADTLLTLEVLKNLISTVHQLTTP